MSWRQTPTACSQLVGNRSDKKSLTLKMSAYICHHNTQQYNVCLKKKGIGSNRAIRNVHQITQYAHSNSCILDSAVYRRVISSEIR